MKTFEPLTDSVFYMMAAFSEPRHGYAVMQLIEDITGGSFVIGPASLYTIIKKLTKAGYIELHDAPDSRRKVYVLTEKGRQALAWDIDRREVMVDFAEKGLARRMQHESN